MDFIHGLYSQLKKKDKEEKVFEKLKDICKDFLLLKSNNSCTANSPKEAVPVKSKFSSKSNIREGKTNAEFEIIEKEMTSVQKRFDSELDNDLDLELSEY